MMNQSVAKHTFSIHKVQTQFKDHFDKVMQTQHRNKSYITAEAIFKNSRDFGMNVLDLLAESYPAFRALMSLCEELFVTAGFAIPPILLQQFNVLSDNPTFQRAKELKILVKLLTQDKRLFLTDNDFFNELLSQKSKDTAKVFNNQDPTFTTKESWWTGFTGTCNADKTKVPDMNATTNLCIFCVNKHFSMVETPAQGTTQLTCADTACNSTDVIIDLGVTLILKTRIPDAKAAELKKTLDVMNQFVVDVKSLTVLPPLQMQTFLNTIQKEMYALLAALDVNQVSTE